MDDRWHPYAVEAAPDGRFYLLLGRSASERPPGFAASRLGRDREVLAFDSAAAVRRFAIAELGARPQDLADEPGRP